MNALKELKGSSLAQLTLLLSSLLAGIFVAIVEDNRAQQQRQVQQQLSASYANMVTQALTQGASAVYPLAALVRDRPAGLESFHAMAKSLIHFNPGLKSLQLAPQGRLQTIEPLPGHQAELGLDLIGDGLIPQQQHTNLSLIGPYASTQYGNIVTYRLAVFLPNSSGPPVFWGFVIALVDVASIIENAKLERLAELGYAFELSRLQGRNESLALKSPAQLGSDHYRQIISVADSQWLLKSSHLQQTLPFWSWLLEGLVAITFVLMSVVAVLLVARLGRARKVFSNKVEQKTRQLSDTFQRLNMAMGSAKQAWFDIDIGSRKIKVSEALATMLGFQEEQMQLDFDAWQNQIIPADRGEAALALDEFLRLGAPLEVDYRISSNSGSYIWLHTVATITQWRGGRPIRGMGIHRNISRRKNTELRDELRGKVLTDLARGIDIDTVLAMIAAAVEEILDHANCAICLRDGEALVHVKDTRLAKSFIKSGLSKIPIGGNTSCCSVAAATGQRVKVENIQNHPYSSRFQAPLLEMNISACVSEPLFSSQGELLGTLSIYHPEPDGLNYQTIKLLNFVSQLCVIAIEKKSNDDKLRLSSKVFRDTMESIAVVDRGGVILDVNPAFSLMTQYSGKEVLGKKLGFLNSGEQDTEFYKKIRRSLIASGHWRGEVWNKRKNGEIYAERLIVSASKDERGEVKHYVCLSSDITEQKQEQQKLEYLAHYDGLTGLPNRTLFADRFAVASALCKRHQSLLAVCYIDLDGFKAVNDNFGHKAGDLLLVEVATRLKNCLREEDAVSRQGGDEFTMLLTNFENIRNLELILKRIQRVLATPLAFEGEMLNVTASIGLSLYPRDDNDLDTLLKHADEAMYQAKLKGRNQYEIYQQEKREAKYKGEAKISWI